MQFVLLTGVSKFGKLSVFSGLNQLKDLSLDARYASLFGYTDAEIDHYFEPWLQAWAKTKGQPVEVLRQGLAGWYNGYSWGGADAVYNPWSVMNALEKQDFRPYWYATGTPGFLVAALKSRQVHLPDLEGYVATGQLQDRASLEDINVFSLLWQTGYWTIKTVVEQGTSEAQFTLGFPNNEVRQALLVEYLELGWPDLQLAPSQLAINIRQALANNNLRAFFDGIELLLASLPYHQYQKQNEAFYHAVVHVAIALSGHRVASEVAVAAGRIDAVVETMGYTYIFEFKLTTPSEALAQIQSNRYATPYLNKGKTVVAVGAAFDTQRKALNGWVSEVL